MKRTADNVACYVEGARSALNTLKLQGAINAPQRDRVMEWISQTIIGDGLPPSEPALQMVALGRVLATRLEREGRDEWLAKLHDPLFALYAESIWRLGGALQASVGEVAGDDLYREVLKDYARIEADAVALAAAMLEIAMVAREIAGANAELDGGVR